VDADLPAVNDRFNPPYDLLYAAHHLVIRESQYSHSSLAQFCDPQLVRLHVIRMLVNSSIQFDGKLCFDTEEVHDKGSYWMLPPEVEPT
jgi:hypothetical protein